MNDRVYKIDKGLCLHNYRPVNWNPRYEDMVGDSFDNSNSRTPRYNRKVPTMRRQGTLEDYVFISGEVKMSFKDGGDRGEFSDSFIIETVI